jgi:hypothetical protein
MACVLGETRLAVFDAFGKNAQRKNLSRRESLIATRVVGQYPWELRHFCEPANIDPALEFYAEVHGAPFT